MSDFDPYHIWLGISETARPISKYRLLAIDDFEDNREVIGAAAERQTIYLRTLQAGEHEVLVAQLLNEVSQARVCLLDGKSKSRYDTQLRSDLEPAPEEDPLAFAAEELAAVVSKPATRSRPRSGGGKPFWQQPWAGAVGGAIVMLLIMLLFGSGGTDTKDPGNKSTTTTLGNQQKTQPTASKETLPAKAATPPLAVAPFDAAQAKAHQKGWSKHLGVPVESTNSIGMKLMLIPPGEFMMGSNEFEDNEKPVHKVTLASPFQLGAYEVTQEQYAKVVGDNPSKFKVPTNPVEANWPDAVAFCSLLTDRPEEKLAGRRYRLPSEAEWEYSCRAGTTTAFSFGSDASLLAEFGWIARNSGGRTHPVGEKKPNAWGLYDMHGNVWERCMDWKGNYPSKDVVNPQGPSDVTIRMTRGGGFNDGNNRLRSATRGGDSHSSNRSSHNGFRVVCVFSGQQEGAASVNATDTVELDQKSAIPADAIQFGGHHYQIVTDKVTWMQAREIAEEAGGHLLQIDSLAEYDFFVSELSSVKLGTPDTEGGHGIWIDGNRLQDGTTYRYENGQPVNFKNMGRVITNYFDYDLFLLYYRGRDGWFVGDSGIQIKRVGGKQTSGYIIEWADDEHTTTFSPRGSLPASLQKGLVAYYPFNGNANDESGNGHHITDRQVTIVKEGRAMISEGGSFEVTIPGLPSANMPRTLALTLVPTDRGINPRMVCYWGTPGALSYFGISYWKGDAHRWFALSEAKVACALSQETQLVLACDGVKVKFYKNGVLVNDEELTMKTAAGDRFYIGSKTNHHSEFEGSIDDIRIYNRALSEKEVRQLYQFENSGTTEVHTSPYYFNHVAPIDVAALRFHFESEKHPLLVNGKRSRHGFLLHPRGMADEGVIRSREGIVTYRKPPNYQFLAGAVAIRDDSFDHFTALIFSLKVDDAVVWKSGPIKTSQQVAGFCIELPRARELTFLVNSQNAGFNNAVWLDPVLLKSTGGKSLEQIANEQQARWIKKEE
jgi:formylglycine-generating enzyme required for sulfatase activity